MPSGFSAIAAGTVTAAAILVRPNLGPLAIVLAAVVLAQRVDQPQRVDGSALLAFGGFAAIGPALLLWSQAALYGHALTPSVRQLHGVLQRRAEFPANLRLYPSLLLELHTALPLDGFGGRAAGGAPRSPE